MLEYALGGRRVNWGELSTAEGDKLLRETLSSLDLHELRGFKSIENAMTLRREVASSLEVRKLDLGSDLAVLPSDPSVFKADLNTHVLPLYRLEGKTTYRQCETREETTDPEKALLWGRSWYIARGGGQILVLRRPRNHTGGDENLMVLRYWHEKVLLEDRHVITKLEAYPLSIENFRGWFGSLYAQVVCELLRELKFAHRRTVSDLESQLVEMRLRAQRIERLSEAIWYA